MNPVVGFLGLIFFCQCLRFTTSIKTDLGIPGTTQTISGYDTELGKDPICWVSQSASASINSGANTTSNDGIVFPNELVADFVVSEAVTLLRQCPEGVNLTVMAPPGLNSSGATPRIATEFDYIVEGSLNLSTLEGRRIISDDGDGRIALQIIVCDAVISGFCSPFVHEQSNPRLAAEGKKTSASPGTMHGGTHIHSEWVFLNLPTNATVLNFEVTVPLMPLVGGQFFTIGYAQFFTTDSLTGNASSVPLTRYDIANAANIPVVTFHPPPRIAEVSLTVEIIVGLAAGLASLVILFLLYQTYIHRNNQIMKLSQGTFLMVLLVSALIGSISVVFINPKNDLYCKLFPPLAYIPCTVIYAVALARVWRAQALLSPLLQEFYESRFTTCFTTFVDVLSCSWRDSGHLRRTVSDGRLVRVILIFTTPELILQILGQVLQPRSAGVRFSKDRSEGSAFCDDGVNELSSFANWSFLSVLILNLILLVVAQASRKLPSLFNEVKGIVAMSAFNCGAVSIGYAIVRLSRSPGSSPSITLIVWGSVVLSITLNSSLRLVWPKLQMIWRGETVLVSKLVADQRANLRGTMKRNNILDNVSGFTHPSADGVESNGKGHARRRRMQEPPVTLISQEEEEDDDDNVESMADDEDLPVSHMPTEGLPAESEPHDNVTHDSIPQQQQQQQRQRQKGKSRRSLVSEDRAPSRNLLVPMLELQPLLNSINARVTSGLGVTRQDWEDLRELATRVGSKFTKDDIFAWEVKENEQESSDDDDDQRPPLPTQLSKHILNSGEALHVGQPRTMAPSAIQEKSELFNFQPTQIPIKHGWHDPC